MASTALRLVPPVAAPDLDTLITDWLAYLRDDRRRSRETLGSYCGDLRHCRAWLTGHLGRAAELRDFTRATLQLWVRSLAALKASTVQRKVAAVRSFFRYLVDQVEILDKDPCRGLVLPEVPPRLPRPLPRAVIDALRAAPWQAPRQARRSCQVRDVAVIELLFGCGLRCIEIERLDISDLVWDQPGPGDLTLWVVGKGMRERPVVVPSDAIPAVVAYLAIRDELRGEKRCRAAFLNYQGQRLSSCAVGKIVWRCVQRLRLKGTAHQLRHTCATALADAGVPEEEIRRFLGHTQSRTTRGYMQISLVQQQKRTTRHHPLSSPPPPSAPRDTRSRYQARRRR